MTPPDPQRVERVRLADAMRRAAFPRCAIWPLTSMPVQNAWLRAADVALADADAVQPVGRDEVRDAARYRYLREHLDYADWTDDDAKDVVVVNCGGSELDAAIDAALATTTDAADGGEVGRL